MVDLPRSPDASLPPFDGRSWNVVFTGPEQAELRQEPVPDLGPGQLLVAASRSLISLGTELICFRRDFSPGTHWERWVQYPFYPGYSSVGRVVAAGEAVEGFAPGTRVAVRAPHCQFFVRDAARALAVPDSITDEEAAWFGLAGIVQNGVRRAEHQLGHAIAVVGLGPLGQLVVQYARLLGAREVIAIDTLPERLELAVAHGATQWVHATGERAYDVVAHYTDGRMADVVYDVTGNAEAFPTCLRLARRFGTVVLLGDTGHPGEQRLTGDVITRGLRIVGAHDNNPPPEATDHAPWSHAAMARLFFTYLEREQMRVGDLVTHRYSPEHAATCYPSLAADRASALGVVFDWSLLGG